MNWLWRFAGLRTAKGNVLKDYLADKVGLRARVDVFLSRLKTMPIPWPTTYYDGSLGDDVGELRIDLDNVEYRLYGSFGPERQQFTIILIGDDKKRQQKFISAAKQLKKQLDRIGWNVEDYDV